MKKIFLTLIVILVLLSCRKDKVQEVPITPGNCPDTISYTDDIQPFLDIHCSSCHNANSANGSYVFENHSQVEEDAEAILGAIRHDSGFSPMPQGGPKLNDSTIQKMECWIEQGKLFN